MSVRPHAPRQVHSTSVFRRGHGAWGGERICSDHRRGRRQIGFCIRAQQAAQPQCCPALLCHVPPIWAESGTPASPHCWSLPQGCAQYTREGTSLRGVPFIPESRPGPLTARWRRWAASSQMSMETRVQMSSKQKQDQGRTGSRDRGGCLMRGRWGACRREGAEQAAGQGDS